MKLFPRPGLKSSLAITTNIGCRNMCSYCPQSTVIKAYRERSGIKKMSLETFKSCMKTVPKNIPLSFSGFSEPWLNPECSAMLLHAGEQGYPIRVNTTLIGMKTADVALLSKLSFIKFVVHLPDNQQLTRIKVDQTYLEVLGQLAQSNMPALHWKFHKSSPDIDLHPEVAAKLQKSQAQIEYFGLNNRAGQVETALNYAPVNRGRVLRPCQDFHHNILLPNGEVALCHMDWPLRHILGNLLHDNYRDLHKGQPFQEILDGLGKPEADILCRACEKDQVKRSLPGQISHSLRKRLGGKKDIY